MFEYTPTDIKTRLADLDSASTKFLEQLPTFLCSEILYENDTVFMIVKFGWIEITEANQKEVTARFRLVTDFDVVEFSSEQQARDLFRASRYQLYRTHWAVREGNAQDILSDLARLKPERVNQVDAPLEAGPAVPVDAPPPPEKKLIGTARNVEGFLKLLFRLSTDKSTETFFRGQEDENYELTPSLLRTRPDGTWQFLPNEDRLCKEVLIAHYDEFQGDQYCFDRLVRMQHYGLPTRLLDITSNPLVALYFACSDAKSSAGRKDERRLPNGEVIVFRVAAERVKYYDSDTVSCIANLSNLTYRQKNEINLNLTHEEFNEEPVSEKLLHHIKSEKGYFERRMEPKHLGSVVCVKAKRNNTRIKSQSGAFLLFGHEAELPSSGRHGIEISRIKIINKKHILQQLSSININDATVYPSIDQTALHLRDRYLTESGS